MKKKESEEEEPTAEAQKHGKTASRFFWATVLLLAGGTIGLYIATALQDARTPREDQEEAVGDVDPAPVEIPQTTWEQLFRDAARQALDATSPEIEVTLDEVYAPVYAAIPKYADFHYSVLGEYTELASAALGQMSSEIEERLFSGFQDRLREAGRQLDDTYFQEYLAALEDLAVDALPERSGNDPLGPVTQKVLQDVIDRALITAPVATVAAGIAGSGAIKVLATGLAKKLATKVAAKAASKGAAKGTSTLMGVGTGAALCSWSGPGAIVCGVAGGAVAWFGADAIVVSIDEYFNRDEFEAELRALVDEDRAEKESLLRQALERKADALGAASSSESVTTDDHTD